MWRCGDYYFSRCAIYSPLCQKWWHVSGGIDLKMLGTRVASANALMIWNFRCFHLSMAFSRQYKWYCCGMKVNPCRSIFIRHIDFTKNVIFFEASHFIRYSTLTAAEIFDATKWDIHLQLSYREGELREISSRYLPSASPSRIIMKMAAFRANSVSPNSLADKKAMIWNHYVLARIYRRLK